MKKIVLCYSIALTILLPTFSYAQSVNPEPGFNTIGQEYNFLQDQPVSKNSFGGNFIVTIADDNTTDPERKKYSPARTASSNNSFAQNFAGNQLSKIPTTEFFIHHRPSLYIFTRVFRL